MLELLKKIGLPATLAAVIASLVVMLPLAFTVDERYAKRVDLKETVEKLEKQNDNLRHELAQLVGYQQAMLTLIQGGKIQPIRPTTFDEQLPSILRVQEINTHRPPSSFMLKVQEVIMMKVQEAKVDTPASSAAAASAPASAASGAKSTLKPKIALDKPSTLKELSDGLYRQQQRLMKD